MDSKNILVVDDDANVRHSLQRILARQGYAVEATGTAEEALAVLPNRPFDLVLTDLQMPGMDGLQLLDEIKRSSPHTPVVMITAHAMTDTVIQALRRGVSDFVTKPYQPDELLIIVARETSRARPAPAASGHLEAPPAVLGRQLSPAQLDTMDSILAELRAEAAARCILIIEGTGHVIAAKGIIEDINISALAALVAGDFAATAGIASILGEDSSFRLNYHEGERYSVYSAQLASDVFLLVVFGQEVKSGMVLYATRRALPDLKKILDQVPTRPARGLPASSEPAGAPPEQDGSGGGMDNLLTFEEFLGSDILNADALNTLDDQFKALWQ